MVKKVFKKVFPSFYVSLRIINAYRLLVVAYWYDIRRYFRHSDYFFNISEEKCVMRIIHRYHPIEKGLTMPMMRLGFGEDNIWKLLDDCVLYKEKYLSKAIIVNSHWKEHYFHALSTLNEYIKTHKSSGYSLNSKLIEKIEYLFIDLKVEHMCEQISMTKDEYFSKVNSAFNEFSFSRHSLRNFEGELNIELINRAVEIAQNTPSACNRQPTRIHVIENKILLQKVLSLQGGNRGFGHLVDKLLIVAVELVGYRGLNERNNMFVDGGLYSMNLLYALHSLKIGACSLNWCYTAERDTVLRELVQIPESQTVVMMIGCGGVPEHFKLAFSKRSRGSDIVKVHS